jgi:hypothetical protein
MPMQPKPLLPRARGSGVTVDSSIEPSTIIKLGSNATAASSRTRPAFAGREADKANLAAQNAVPAIDPKTLSKFESNLRQMGQYINNGKALRVTTICRQGIRMFPHQSEKF